jgi:hypothetical protein
VLARGYGAESRIACGVSGFGDGSELTAFAGHYAGRVKTSTPVTITRALGGVTRTATPVGDPSGADSNVDGDGERPER